MKVLSGRQPCRLLEVKGWTLARVAGSHHIYVKQGSIVRLSVPVHGDRPLKKGLLYHLLRQAGIRTESQIHRPFLQQGETP